jgi:hypothetical protein
MTMPLGCSETVHPGRRASSGETRHRAAGLSVPCAKVFTGPLPERLSNICSSIGVRGRSVQGWDATAGRHLSAFEPYPASDGSRQNRGLSSNIIGRLCPRLGAASALSLIAAACSPCHQIDARRTAQTPTGDNWVIDAATNRGGGQRRGEPGAVGRWTRSVVVTGRFGGSWLAEVDVRVMPRRDRQLWRRCRRADRGAVPGVEPRAHAPSRIVVAGVGSSMSGVARDRCRFVERARARWKPLAR